jgi:hypothetical protein
MGLAHPLNFFVVQKQIAAILFGAAVGANNLALPFDMPTCPTHIAPLNIFRVGVVISHFLAPAF